MTGMETRGVVYRLLDANRRIIYIGSTHDLTSRVLAHRANSVWGDRIAEVRHSRRWPMPEARRRECGAIFMEQPPLNRIRNPLYVGLTRAEKVQRFQEALALCPVVSLTTVPIVDDEPQFLLEEMRDLGILVGGTS